MKPDLPPIILPLSNYSVTVPESLFINFPPDLIIDPEGLNYRAFILVNSSTEIPHWLSYDLYSYHLEIFETTEDMVGDHKISIVAQDDFNPEVREDFVISILPSAPPNNTLPTIFVTEGQVK